MMDDMETDAALDELMQLDEASLREQARRAPGVAGPDISSQLPQGRTLPSPMRLPVAPTVPVPVTPAKKPAQTLQPPQKPKASLTDLNAQLQQAGAAPAPANKPTVTPRTRPMTVMQSVMNVDLETTLNRMPVEKQQGLVNAMSLPDVLQQERLEQYRQEQEEVAQGSSTAMEELKLPNAALPQQHSEASSSMSAHEQQQHQAPSNGNSNESVASYVIGSKHDPSAVAVRDEIPFWVHNLELISPDPDLAWRRRCPPHMYFLDIHLEDLFVHVWVPKAQAGGGDNAGSGRADAPKGDSGDMWVTIRSKKQGDRPLRYRGPLALMGECLLGYGNWKGLPSNTLRRYCPTDIKQAKQQVIVKSTAWNKLTATTSGQHSWMLAFCEWRMNLQRWYVEKLVEMRLVKKYIDADVNEDMNSRRKLLAEQLKDGRITRVEVTAQLDSWKKNPPMDTYAIIQNFLSKHITMPVKLRNVKVQGDGGGGGWKRARDGTPITDNGNSSAPTEAKMDQSGGPPGEDFDVDSVLNPSSAKTGVPHTEYVVLEKKVLRAPSKMKEGDEQSEAERMKSRPYKAQTPLLQQVWDKNGLLHDEIKMVQLAAGDAHIVASSIEMMEQSEAVGVTMPAEFKAKRKLQTGMSMSSSSDSKESKACKVEPGMTGSLQPGKQYKYSNPTKTIDWNKAAIRAGDIWAFEVEIACFTSSPQKTAGLKDKPMKAFFYRHSRAIERETQDDTSVMIPGAEQYGDDRQSAMLTDADMLQALANTEAEIQQQRSAQQQNQPMSHSQYQFQPHNSSNNSSAPYQQNSYGPTQFRQTH